MKKILMLSLFVASSINAMDATNKTKSCCGLFAIFKKCFAIENPQEEIIPSDIGSVYSTSTTRFRQAEGYGGHVFIAVHEKPSEAILVPKYGSRILRLDHQASTPSISIYKVTNEIYGHRQ